MTPDLETKAREAKFFRSEKPWFDNDECGIYLVYGPSSDPHEAIAIIGPELCFDEEQAIGAERTVDAVLAMQTEVEKLRSERDDLYVQLGKHEDVPLIEHQQDEIEKLQNEIERLKKIEWKYNELCK